MQNLLFIHLKIHLIDKNVVDNCNVKCEALITYDRTIQQL